MIIAEGCSAESLESDKHAVSGSCQWWPILVIKAEEWNTEVGGCERFFKKYKFIYFNWRLITITLYVIQQKRDFVDV